LSALLALTGCTTQPTTYVAIYGKYLDESDRALDVIPRNESTGSVTNETAHPDPIVRLFERVLEVAPTNLRDSAGQAHMQGLPAAGREDLHSRLAGNHGDARRCDRDDAVTQSPVDEIVRRAEESRVVIINEAHDRPRDREFIRKVAVRLKAIGYSTYSAETFGPLIASTSNQKYASVADGNYSNEPVFGRLIRDLKSHGYALRDHESRVMGAVAGEAASVRVRHREEAQANNLLATIEMLGPTERLLVHVGYSHAAEVPIPGFDKQTIAWMAARLKEKSGIDPLTIDQTHCSTGAVQSELMAPNPRLVDGQFDLLVGHPTRKFVQGRPTYRMREGSSLVSIPSELLSRENRVIVEARFAGEPLDAVPVDRLMLWPTEALPFVLPIGRFELVSFEENTDIRRTLEITVD